MQHHHTTRVCFSLLIVLGSFCPGIGCIGNDSHWDHYMSGGRYPAEPPSYSHDGNQIVFAAPFEGESVLFIADSSGDNVKRLVEGDGNDFNPIWSPDGEWIAFERESADDRCVWLVRPDGTEAHALVDDDAADDLIGFTNDSKHIFFVRAAPNKPSGPNYDIYIVETGSSPEKRKAERIDGRPRVINHKPGIVLLNRYDQDLNLHKIYLYNYLARTERYLCDGYAIDVNEQGNQIIVSSEDEKTWRTVDLETGNQEVEFDFDVSECSKPVFASDGSSIVFGKHYNHELWRCDVDGHNLTSVPLPEGIFAFSQRKRCPSGIAGVAIPLEDRVGEAYLLDTKTWTFQKIVSYSEPQK